MISTVWPSIPAARATNSTKSPDLGARGSNSARTSAGKNVLTDATSSCTWTSSNVLTCSQLSPFLRSRMNLTLWCSSSWQRASRSAASASSNFQPVLRIFGSPFERCRPTWTLPGASVPTVPSPEETSVHLPSTRFSRTNWSCWPSIPSQVASSQAVSPTLSCSSSNLTSRTLPGAGGAGFFSGTGMAKTSEPFSSLTSLCQRATERHSPSSSSFSTK